MKQSHQMRTTLWFGKMTNFLLVLLLLSACQPLVQPISPAQVNDPLVTATLAESTFTPIANPSVTPETQAIGPLVESNMADLPHPFDSTGNNPMSPQEKLLLNTLELQLAIPLPEHPQQIALYRRQPETLTKEGAMALFKQMGIDGSVSRRTAEAGNAIFTASGQGYMMNVDSDFPPFFVFGRGDPSVEPGTQPFEERKQLAEGFLQAHQLPDFSYRIEPVYGPYGQNQVVAVAQMIDNIPLYQGRSPWIWLAFDGHGQLFNMVFQKLQLVPHGQIALRPAGAVWDDLQAHRLEHKTMLRILSNEEWQGGPSAQKATIHEAELVYLAANTGGMWVGSIPADSPIRLVLPVWHFTGQLTDGTPIEILTEATDGEKGEVSQPTAAEASTADGSPWPTGMIKANAGDETVNVRNGPGAIFDRIGTLANGETVHITGRSPQWEWWRIQTDELEGWVYSAYLMVDSAGGIPCVEQKVGDCATSELPPEHDQAIASIRTFRNQSDLLLTYGGETPNPNADMRDSLVYWDDQGGEYLVDKEKLQVMHWTPQTPADSGATKSVEELRSLALTFAYRQSPHLAQNASNLSFTQMTKDGSNYAFRWEDQSITGHMMTPFLQVVIRTDGEILQYINTLDI